MYCNVCISCTACSGVVCRYAALCHHHGLPRVQVTCISTAENACTPSGGFDELPVPPHVSGALLLQKIKYFGFSSKHKI